MALRFGVFLWTLIALTAPFSAWTSTLELVLMGHFLLVGMSIGAALVSLGRERVVARQRERRAEIEGALDKVGVPDGPPPEVGFGERVRRLVSDNAHVFAGVVGVQIGVGHRVLLDLWGGWGEGTLDAAGVALAVFVLVPLPIYLARLLWSETKEHSENAAATRAERLLERATQDRAQAVGGLELDAQAPGSGGGLTVRAEAGSVQVHEEVLLGFDEVAEDRAQEASVQEEVAR